MKWLWTEQVILCVHTLRTDTASHLRFQGHKLDLKMGE